MNVLPLQKQTRIVAALAEGCSIRATERMTGVHRDTIMRLGTRIGQGCERVHDSLVRDVNVAIIECDEIWSFIQKKQKKLKPEDSAEKGDTYTWIGIDAVKKAIISYETGKRDGKTALVFAMDLRERILNRPQITTDGLSTYIDAIENAFGADVDYAMLIKEYESFEPQNDAAHRYSPGRVTSSETRVITGKPDDNHISTSLIERQNLTLRMQQRRFTRLTNAFSKKLENHQAAVSLYVCWYNFCRVHETIRVTPAMELGIADRPWTIEELILAALATENEAPGTPLLPTPAPPIPPSKPAAPVLSVGAINRMEREQNKQRRERKHERHQAEADGVATAVPWLRVINGGKAA